MRFCWDVKRFGDKDASNVDIFQVDKKKIPNHTLLVGGFPCQDYSVAQTLSNSKGIEGKKGVLWWAINDILKEKGYINVERVKNDDLIQRRIYVNDMQDDSG